MSSATNIFETVCTSESATVAALGSVPSPAHPVMISPKIQVACSRDELDRNSPEK